MSSNPQKENFANAVEDFKKDGHILENVNVSPEDKHKEAIKAFKKEIKKLNRLQVGTDPSTVYQNLISLFAEFAGQIDIGEMTSLMTTVNDQLRQIMSKEIDEPKDNESLSGHEVVINTESLSQEDDEKSLVDQFQGFIELIKGMIESSNLSEEEKKLKMQEAESLYDKNENLGKNAVNNFISSIEKIVDSSREKTVFSFVERLKEKHSCQSNEPTL